MEMFKKECLHNNVKEFKLVFPLLSDNFKFCLLDLKKIKYITWLLLIKFKFEKNNIIYNMIIIN
jgi:hypothetical protein